eukprot:1158883-Pelagomonas_calceolata.AAC.7
MDYERVRNVAAGYKDKVKKTAAAKAGSEPRRESRGSGKSPRSFKFRSPRRKSSQTCLHLSSTIHPILTPTLCAPYLKEGIESYAEAHASSPKDAQDKTQAGGRPRTPGLGIRSAVTEWFSSQKGNQCPNITDAGRPEISAPAPGDGFAAELAVVAFC